MPLDPTISLQAKAPDAMTSISSMLGAANSAQQLQNSQQTYKSNDLALQSQDQANNERKNVIRLMQSDPSLKPAADGTFDLNPDNLAKIQQAAPQTFNEVIQHLATTNQQMTQARGSIQELGNQTAKTVSNAIQSLNGKSPTEKAIGMNVLAQTIPQTKPLVDRYLHTVQQATQGLPEDATREQQQQVLAPIDMFWSKFPLTQEQQNSLATPNYVNTGGQLQNVSPAAAQAGATPTITNTLPPTTPVIGPNNTPGYLGQPAGDQSGPQGLDLSKLSPVQQQFLAQKNPGAFANGAAHFQQTAQQKPAFVASGLPVGSGESIGGTVGAINKHWVDTQSSANTAQQDIGVLQNIKQHAAGAATGVGADRQALVAGIAGLLGMDSGQLEKTNTDLLAKNSNMLALAGGDTNLARTMAEAATPNSHMTKEAIIQAADQVIAQRKLALARQQFLTPFKAMADQGHPEMYNNALNQFNSVADPRVIQFTSMSPAEKSSMKSSMTPKEREEFGSKLGKARQLGIAQ